MPIGTRTGLLILNITHKKEYHLNKRDYGIVYNIQFI
jgi:hypothetical protein